MAVRALRVHVIVGEFRNVDSEALTFAFDSLKGLYNETTSCALELETISARALCHDHGHAYHPTLERAFSCEKCGSGIGELACGKELDIINISLEGIVDKERSNYARVT